MHLRKTLLSQYIQRTLSAKPSALWLTLGLLATPVHAQDGQLQWSCKASADGLDWQCQQQTANGPSYKRPQHSKASSAYAASVAIKPRTLNAAQTDWVDEEQLSDEQQANIGCCGAYIEPVRTDDEVNLSPEDAPLRASAANSEMTDGSVAVLAGDVKLTQGSMQLEADSAKLDQNTSLANIEGNIRIRQPGLLVTGDNAELNIDDASAVVNNASYLIHAAHMRGDADRLIHNPDNSIVMEDGTFTRCEPDSNTWYLRGSEIKIDPNTNQGTAKHIRLNIKDVPVLYIPYLRFPASNDRMTGLLFPSLSSSGRNGFEYAQPIYVNLAPNYDLTLTPRVLTERGTMLEVEARHLSESFESELSTAFLGNDDGGDVKPGEPKLYQGQDRWLAGFEQSGHFGSNFSSNIDFTRVSDIDYFRDLGNSSLSVNSSTHLSQAGRLNYSNDNWKASIKAQTFQTIALDTQTPYQQMPRVNVNGNYRVAGDVVLKLNNEYVRFDHRDTFYKDDITDRNITGSRARFDYGAQWDNNWAWGFVKPGVGIKSLHYQLDSATLVAGANNKPSVTVPQASIDSGLYFERDGSLFSNDYVQTFEPRLFYFYSDYQDQDELMNINQLQNRSVDFDSSELTFNYNQLFRDSRFSGGDRIADDDRLSVGLTTRFIDPETGIENFSASIGQIFHYNDRRVFLNPNNIDEVENNLRNSSQVAGQFNARVSENWQFNSDVLVDTKDSNRVDLGSAALRYNDDEHRIVNLGYRFTRKANGINIDQGDVSFAQPIYGNWNILGRYNYDFTFKRELETIAGVEYNSCCYRFRAVYREWVDNNVGSLVSNLDKERGIFLEFQLKGLGGIGKKSASFLSDSIYGFSKREDYYR